MGKVLTVNERHLLLALKKQRDLREWAVRRHIDPWAFREALILVLHIDAAAALERGVPPQNIQTFDDLVVENAAEIMQAKGHGSR